MYCQRCGTVNPGNNRFCICCGAPMQTPAPMVSPAPQASNPAMAQKVCDTLKSLATSPLLIIAAACYTLTLLFSVLLSGSLLDSNSIYYMLREMGMGYYDAYEIAYGMQPNYLIFTIIGMIPSVLVAIGMWITVGSGANRRSRNMTTSGLTMIQVIQIIMTVLSGLAILLLLLLVIILSGSIARLSEEATIIIAICGFVVIAAGAFLLFYNIMVINTIGKIKESIRTNTPDSRVSMFVIVMLFISGSLSAIAFLIGLMTPQLTAVSLISAFSNLLSAALPILFASLLIVYRSRMRQLEDEIEGRNAPIYVPAPAAPVYNGYAGQPYAPAPQYMPPQPVMQEAPVQPAEPEITPEVP